MIGVLEAQIQSTLALRRQIQSQIDEVKDALKNDPANFKLRRKVELLQEKIKTPLLYLGNKGWHAGQALNPRGWTITTPDNTTLNTVLRSVIERYEIRDANGKLLSITVSDLRDAWIGYAYQKSGYSWLIGKLAAGHANASTLRAYLRQRQWRARGEQQVLKLQDALWKEVRGRRMIEPSILRMMVERGDITDEQRVRLEAYKERTRMGMGCRDPEHPPVSVAPGHVQGMVCRVQRCVLCPHGLLFADSLDGLTRRKAELLYIRETTPISLWLQST